MYVAFDVLYRLLHRGLRYDVTYVRNFTDVDDKIIRRAAESGEEPLALASRFIDEFHADMAALNCLPPTVCVVCVCFLRAVVFAVFVCCVCVVCWLCTHSLKPPTAALSLSQNLLTRKH